MSEELRNKETETFEKAIRLMQCIANNGGCGYEYREHWSREYRAESMSSFIEKIKSDEKYGTDFWNAVFALPQEQKRLLGFLKWSDEEKVMCIPIWIWACLPDDMTIGGNGGGEMKKDLDNDIRFGCVWWRV